MSNQVLQPTRALNVIPSDDVNIPYPNIAASGTTTSGGSFLLVDNSGVDFISQGIKVGDSIWNVTSGVWTVVTSVSPEELGLAQDAFPSGSETYIIYQGENTGCTLFVGTGGSITVLTADNNDVELAGVPDGSFIPIKVLRVYASPTSCSNIIALW